MPVRRGEIWWANLGKPQGYEQALERPVVVVQTDQLNDLSTTVVVPLTSRSHHAGLATTVTLATSDTGFTTDQYALCLHLRVLDQRKMTRRLGQVSPPKLSEIEATVAFVLGLP